MVQVRVPSQAKREVIDEEKGIVSFTYEAEEEYYDVASIRRLNHLETKTARGLDAKNRALLADVQEARATMNDVNPELDKLVAKAEKLFSINHDSGRIREIVSNKIYALLVRAKQIIMTSDYKRKLIATRKIETQVIGKEYVAPYTSGPTLEEEYNKKLEDLNGEDNASI